MNANLPTLSDRLNPRRLAILASLLLVALLGTGCFRVSSSTQALREVVLENIDGFWEERIEFSAGQLTFAAARLGSRFVELPPEARTILDSARGAEVSVWESSRGGAMDGAAILKEADLKMIRNGWTRLVGVLDRDNLVAVYLPSDFDGTGTVMVSVMVVNRNQVVCAAARSKVEPLLELAMGKVREESEFLAAQAR